ncbi:MAG: ImmA/IrrE family metallo-endopeptidase [Acidobacteriota bacterium]
MSKLQFQVEWESPGSARGEELRATWARLRIDVGGEPVTRVEDKRAGSVRDAVYGPIYPLAEWIATNWWRLLHEVVSPTRIARNAYGRCHSLSSASEGFALPCLKFHPEGERIGLAWDPLDVPTTAVRFLAGGHRYVDRAEVTDSLWAFVSSVVARLEDQGCPNTLLAEEWSAIEACDTEEQEFCTLAARLGRDPYALSESQGLRIIKAAESIPEAIREEFFSAADIHRFQSQARTVSEWIHHARESDLQVEPLLALRASNSHLDRSRAPWEQGYRFARHLRRRLSLKDRLTRSETDLADALGVDQQDWQAVTADRTDQFSFLDALVGVTAGGAPRFAMPPRSGRSSTFTLCRALFEYLHTGNAPAGLVAPIYSDRQKRNRAFAAEFLVPASQLRRKIRGKVVTEDEIQDFAEHFGTSDFVVRHQIHNHGLAQLSSWTV